MVIFIKLFLISILFILIYFWNKFVPKLMVRIFRRKIDLRRLSKEEIKLALANEDFFIKIIKSFYWLGFLVFVYIILSVDLSALIK